MPKNVFVNGGVSLDELDHCSEETIALDFQLLVASVSVLLSGVVAGMRVHVGRDMNRFLDREDNLGKRCELADMTDVSFNVVQRNGQLFNALQAILAKYPRQLSSNIQPK